MSNTGNNGEPSAAGQQNFAGSYGVGAGVNINLSQLESAAAAIESVTQSLSGLKSALQDIGSNGYQYGAGVNGVLNGIARNANTAGQSLRTASGGGGGWESAAATQAGTAISGAGGGGGGVAGWGGGGGTRPGGTNLGAILGTGQDFLKDLMLSPIRYLRDRIQTNRDTALQASGTLSMASFQQGVSPNTAMTDLSKFPGNIMGGPAELAQLFAMAPALGASFRFGAGGAQGAGQGVRARGFFEGIREAQILNPMAQVTDIAGAIGGFAGNTQAQQASAFYTGGAFSMIGAGGRQKSLSDWAEGVLRWLEGLRGGADRGKPFDYGQLMAQYFPGSNIDAWFDANGVPQNLRDYWWTYALGKANRTGSTGGARFQITPDTAGGNLAFERLRSTTELTRTEFGLAGAMGGAYANREQANRWFNQLFGQLQTQLIPAIVNKLPALEMLPDTIETFLMQLLERGASEASSLGRGLFGAGDVPEPGNGGIGDLGIPGAMGGTSTAGLIPDMRRKVGAMQRANPRLKVVSGVRDHAMQQRLRAKGHNRVSGGPSDHTRGWAADLGPASEYPWIVANAKKFGLKSGISHDEPWHVGIGDIGDPIEDLISNPDSSQFLDWLKGFGQPDQFAGLVSSLVNMLTGSLGVFGLDVKGTTTPGPAYKPDLFNQLVSGTKKFEIGKGKPSGLEYLKGRWAALASAASGLAGGGLAGAIGPDGLMTGSGPGAGQYGNIRTPASEFANFNSSDEMTRGAAVARALYAAGFRGQDLINFTTISQRESGWFPSKWVDDDDDLGGGILGLNLLVNPPSRKTHSLFTKAEIIDPYASAKIGYDMWADRGMDPWVMDGGDWRRWLKFDKGAAAVRAAGLGDAKRIVDYQASGLNEATAFQLSMPTAVPSKEQQIVFNNKFEINMGGGGNTPVGFDMRRAAEMMAQHLEEQVNRKLVRTN